MSTTTADALPAPAPAAPKRAGAGTRETIGFFTMVVGMFMAILDVQVVATSLPTIQHALDIAQDQMSWIQTAYLIAEIISIPLTGFLMRMLTMRWLFVGAISVFTVASIACAALPRWAPRAPAIGVPSRLAAATVARRLAPSPRASNR